MPFCKLKMSDNCFCYHSFTKEGLICSEGQGVCRIEGIFLKKGDIYKTKTIISLYYKTRRIDKHKILGGISYDDSCMRLCVIKFSRPST